MKTRYSMNLINISIGPCYALVTAILLSLSVQVTAQDIHYTQFYNAPFNISPSLLGVFNGDLRITANHKEQWASVPVDYETYTFSVEKRLSTTRSGFFTGGLIVDQDRAGDLQLNNTSVGLAGSYTRRLSEQIALTFGTSFSVNQRSFNQGNITTNNQFVDGTFQSTASIGENFADDSRPNNWFPDFSAGLNFHWQPVCTKDPLISVLENRTRFDVGFGLYHLNTPNQSFVEGATKSLPIRVSPYLYGTLQLGKDSRIDLVGHFTFQAQTSYREFLAGTGIRVHIINEIYRQFSVQVGPSFRFTNNTADAVAPVVQVQYNGWQVGVSWDSNISQFRDATNGNGGMELSLQYVLPLKPNIFRICPIY